MEANTIDTDDGSIELRTDYTTGNARLASQDGALTVTFDRLKIRGGELKFFRGSGLATAISVEQEEADRIVGIIERGQSEVEIERP